MFNNAYFARFVAFAMSATVTLSVVVLIAEYGLPADGPQMLVQTSTTATQ
jgi:hypothetical protein